MATAVLTMKNLLVVSLLIGQSLAILNLAHKSITKLSGCENDDGQVNNGMFNYGAVKAAFHSDNNMLYILGRPPDGAKRNNGCLRIFNNLNSDHPTLLHSETLKEPLDGEVTNIAVCHDTLTLSFNGINPGNEGHVRFYKPYALGDTQLVAFSSEAVTVGYNPKHMSFTHDCSKLVVANEGTPIVLEGEVVDPAGSISIISRGSTPVVQHIHFGIVDGANTNLYVSKGIRYVFRGHDTFTNTMSRDLEPEFVAINTDDSVAYVSLQENNGVAVVDLTSNALIDIYALGEKHWESFELDASDRDNAHNYGYYQLYSYPQPAFMIAAQLYGANVLITANTGARKSLNFGTLGSFEEAERILTLVNDGDIGVNAFSPAMNAAFMNESLLGRLFVSTTDGRNSITNKMEKLSFFGTRDLAMFHFTGNGLNISSNTGDELERFGARDYGAVFNGDTTDVNLSPILEMDSRSDDMGPEPRALAGGFYGNNNISFAIAGTRNGILYVYTMRTGTPTFESMYRSGGLQNSWGTLYNNGNTGDNIISDMGTIEKNILTANPFIYVVSEGSGTFSIYELQET